jgi:hypothetical protein
MRKITTILVCVLMFTMSVFANIYTGIFIGEAHNLTNVPISSLCQLAYYTNLMVVNGDAVGVSNGLWQWNQNNLCYTNKDQSDAGYNYFLTTFGWNFTNSEHADPPVDLLAYNQSTDPTVGPFYDVNGDEVPDMAVSFTTGVTLVITPVTFVPSQFDTNAEAASGNIIFNRQFGNTIPDVDFTAASSVLGGINNTIENLWRFGPNEALIVGGAGNHIYAYAGSPGSGASYSVIVGGTGNTVTNMGGMTSGYSYIGGGLDNFAYGYASTIVGGNGNTAGANGNGNPFPSGATVCGGNFNLSLNDASTVGGGEANSALGPGSFVGGGGHNTATGYVGSVCGGYANYVDGNYAFTVGGLANTNLAQFGFISGGYLNTINANATYGVINGGTQNTVSGAYATAGGVNSTATYQGSWVWSDSNGGEADTAPNQWRVSAHGGFFFDSGVINANAGVTSTFVTATTGVASTYTNRTLSVTTTGITNTLTVNYRILGFTGTSVTQSNSVGPYIFSRGTITVPTDITLQPNEVLKGTSCAAQGGQAW